ncbi:MAG: formylglycine-generating enzyme family protein [Bacteroidota bacterium]
MYRRSEFLKRIFCAKGLCAALITLNCGNGPKINVPSDVGDKKSESRLIETRPKNTTAPKGKIWIPGGRFYQGAVIGDSLAMNHEKPRHEVIVDGFFMDIHPVTNGQFEKFVRETGYITVAEREINWEDMKRQLPPNTPRPNDSLLKPGSLVFKKTESSVPNLYDYSQWWEWKIGANWRSPTGPGSSILGMENYPVVHISYEDALAYCEWSNSRLPTEAEWEYAARGHLSGAIYFWGNEIEELGSHANTWEGEFPVVNTGADGFERLAPVGNYPKNSFGLYGMSGNVWEWTMDWYDISYYSKLASNGKIKNPEGPTRPFNPNNPRAREKVIKGGSFLCSASYCASYRISARMATSIDSGLEHLGFRTVQTPK